jgi:Pregnancy-associated plasma protein-A
MFHRSFSSSLRRVGLAAVLALALSPLAAAPAAATPSAQAIPSSSSECRDGASSARVIPGSEGELPNDVTGSQVASTEELLAAAVRRAGFAAVFKLAFGRLHVTVPLRVHVITRDDGSGAPSHAALKAQLDVLNDAYSGQGLDHSVPTIFRFKVKSIDYTANTDWYDWSRAADTDDAEAKEALHVGGREDLNIYVTGLEDALGYATFPFEEPLFRDGVVIYNETLPGGGMENYSLGDNLVHEVGHWLGVFHTFENGCLAPGDGVSDTPFQDDGDNIVSCDDLEDSCLEPGFDPVHNFMSYSDDLCRDRFTFGQSVRMGLSWLAFRSHEAQPKWGHD